MYRCIGEILDSEFSNRKDEIGEKGTASLTARTRKTCKKLKMMEDKLIVKKKAFQKRFERKNEHLPKLFLF
jgi:hypothetical protein